MTAAEILLHGRIMVKCSGFNPKTKWVCPMRYYCVRWFIHHADQRMHQLTSADEGFAQYEANPCTFRNAPPMGFSEFNHELQELKYGKKGGKR